MTPYAFSFPVVREYNLALVSVKILLLRNSFWENISQPNGNSVAPNKPKSQFYFHILGISYFMKTDPAQISIIIGVGNDK